ncbi:16S rRNA (adenine(1518)-N(6)/adenine(1519)-N(6))-dimethyltransferase RsmA [Kiritimatiellota bacterium B12222]|nr:16S rRNA (adenine(1518)-N(6)/adenine(1519)-N(6))-dimethyltransferase RsmA [Kiritimatiellota bacterium B12222]
MEDVYPCLTRSREVRHYLSDIGFSPSKSMGQNFLIDANMRDLILDASGVGSEDMAVEIGPGLGVMTEGLMERAKHVTAIELDFRLAEHLQQRFSERRNLTLLNQDATKTDWEAFVRPDPVRVISNLPYSVGSRILYDLADPALAPVSITVMLQSDVADRMLAAPASDLYGLLTVRMSWAYEISRVRNVPGNCFLPPPRVGSSVVHLERRTQAPAEVNDYATLEKLSRFAFTKRRKQLKSILKSFGTPMDDGPVDLTRRPETLNLEEWAALSNAVSGADKG